MSWTTTLFQTLERIDLAAWLPPQVLAAPPALKAFASALILILPGLLTLSVLLLLGRRFVLRTRAVRLARSVASEARATHAPAPWVGGLATPPE
jgi:hypothetical protein